MWNPFKKKYSSRELEQSYGKMSSLQKEHYDKLTTKITPEKAMNALGVKKGIVPDYETREQWRTIKKQM